MTTVNNNDLLAAALAYAAMGWPVFPVGDDKRPLTTHGFKSATRDKRLITSWWSLRHLGAGIGMAIPEGLLVLDIDPRNGGVRGEELPATKESGTRSGGAHLYYSVPPDRTFHGQYQPGVDIKAPGKGYVILPPTPGYKWTRRGPAVDLPSDVLESCTRKVGFSIFAPTDGRPRYLPWEDATRYGAVALANQVERVATAGNGERNNTLNAATWSVARLIAGGELREEPALRALYEAGLAAGLGDYEVLQTMESAYSVGIQEPRTAPTRETT